jgi:hypothetical protein
MQLYDAYVCLLRRQIELVYDFPPSSRSDLSLLEDGLVVFPSCNIMTNIFEGNNPAKAFSTALKRDIIPPSSSTTKKKGYPKVVFGPVYIPEKRHFVLFVIYTETHTVYFYDDLRGMYRTQFENILR